MDIPPQRIPHVFISHDSADKPLARRIARRLAQCGARAILDEAKFKPGEKLPESIPQSIRHSTHCAVIWTDAAAKSSAIADSWLRTEIELANDTPTVVLLPLLFIAPERQSLISNTLGVNFQTAHRFEQSFEIFLHHLFSDRWAAPTLQQLLDDFGAALSETSSIRAVFVNPVEKRHQYLQSSLKNRDQRLAELTKVFDAWQPEGRSMIGLPRITEPDFHALDFALWSAVQIVLARRRELKPLLPIELAKYPEFFGKVLGSTGAGFEALAALTSEYPGLSQEVFGQLLKPENVPTDVLPIIVDLFEHAFAACRGDRARDQFTPYGSAYYFLLRNIGRLSLNEKRVFLRLIEEHEEGPYPGGPVDILSALSVDPTFVPSILQKVRSWVEQGRFDGCDVGLRSDSPRIYYGFVNGLLKRDCKEEGEALARTAQARIKKLFRSPAPEDVVAAFRWIADSDRMPFRARGFVERGYEEGAFSSEFERREHAPVLASLARLLVNDVTRNERIGERVLGEVRSKLKECGLPDYLA